jgi:hypothetical protein
MKRNSDEICLALQMFHIWGCYIHENEAYSFGIWCNVGWEVGTSISRESVACLQKMQAVYLLKMLVPVWKTHILNISYLLLVRIFIDVFPLRGGLNVLFSLQDIQSFSHWVYLQSCRALCSEI